MGLWARPGLGTLPERSVQGRLLVLPLPAPPAPPPPRPAAPSVDESLLLGPTLAASPWLAVAAAAALAMAAVPAGVSEPVGRARRVMHGIMMALSAATAKLVGVSLLAKGCCVCCPPTKHSSHRSKSAHTKQRKRLPTRGACEAGTCGNGLGA